MLRLSGLLLLAAVLFGLAACHPARESAPGDSRVVQTNPDTLPGEYSGDREDWDEWSLARDRWFKETYGPCMKSAGLRMSCGGCASIYIKFVFTTNEDGRIISMEKYKENVCGAPPSPELERCLSAPYQGTVFSKLRSRKFRATLGTGLSC